MVVFRNKGASAGVKEIKNKGSKRGEALFVRSPISSQASAEELFFSPKCFRVVVLFLFPEQLWALKG